MPCPQAIAPCPVLTPPLSLFSAASPRRIPEPSQCHLCAVPPCRLRAASPRCPSPCRVPVPLAIVTSPRATSAPSMPRPWGVPGVPAPRPPCHLRATSPRHIPTCNIPVPHPCAVSPVSRPRVTSARHTPPRGARVTSRAVSPCHVPVSRPRVTPRRAVSPRHVPTSQPRVTAACRATVCRVPGPCPPVTSPCHSRVSRHGVPRPLATSPCHGRSTPCPRAVSLRRSPALSLAGTPQPGPVPILCPQELGSGTGTVAPMAGKLRHGRATTAGGWARASPCAGATPLWDEQSRRGTQRDVPRRSRTRPRNGAVLGRRWGGGAAPRHAGAVSAQRGARRPSGAPRGGGGAPGGCPGCYLVKKGRWCWLRPPAVRGDSVLAMTSLNQEATSTSSVS